MFTELSRSNNILNFAKGVNLVSVNLQPEFMISKFIKQKTRNDGLFVINCYLYYNIEYVNRPLKQFDIIGRVIKSSVGFKFVFVKKITGEKGYY